MLSSVLGSRGSLDVAATGHSCHGSPASSRCDACALLTSGTGLDCRPDAVADAATDECGDDARPGAVRADVEPAPLRRSSLPCGQRSDAAPSSWSANTECMS